MYQNQKAWRIIEERRVTFEQEYHRKDEKTQKNAKRGKDAKRNGIFISLDEA